MNADFWNNKWRNNEIGFHLIEVNALLTDNIHQLKLPEASRLFLPLCGKTLDIGWLLESGYQVVGIELIESAIEQLFSELAVKPQIESVGRLKCYQASNVKIFAGDFFDLSTSDLGDVDAVYDRASLIALPEQERKHYAAHLATITKRAPQLLVNLDYDQSQLQGPPFAVTEEEIKRFYSSHYKIELVKQSEVDGGLKGKCKATENVWLLTPSAKTISLD